MKRIIDWDELRDLSPEERARVERVNCGPDCEFCDEKRGISIGRMDSFGVVHADATSVILDKRANEWVVYVLDLDADMHEREAARYPASEVEAIRNLPCETRLYSHNVLDA